MKNNLSKVIAKIGEDYKGNIRSDSRFYIEVSIAGTAGQLGFADIEACYKDAYAIVPLKQPMGGMKVRIDGRTFVNYSQFDWGRGAAVCGQPGRSAPQGLRSPGQYDMQFQQWFRG